MYQMQGHLLLAGLFLALLAGAVDRSNFKTCSQSSFCTRNRALKEGNSAYNVDVSSLKVSGSKATMDIKNVQSGRALSLQATALENNSVRVTVTDPTSKHPRHQVSGVVSENLKEKNFVVQQQYEDSIILNFGESSTLFISFSPLNLEFIQEKNILVKANSHGLLNFESYREKGENEPAGAWEETFKTHSDTKPLGPSSVGIDFSFPNTEHVYGIPEHADSFSLRSTTTTDPYRLYNLDVFEYELDNPMALYGSIPFMVAHGVSHTAGVLLLNSAEMWVDVTHSKSSSLLGGVLSKLTSLFGDHQPPEASAVPQVDTHWFAESGILDFYVLLGPSPKQVFAQYAELTGTVEVPPLFSVAYHQCRWNYNDEQDVLSVQAKMDEADIPFDVIWLDIEHTNGKKYFTWDTAKFPNPVVMQDKLAAVGRKLVNIIDPHIKREGGYHIHDEATRLGYYIKNKDGGDYEGHCWPGSSSWLDFLNPTIQSWWSDQLSLANYQGSTPALHVWNDMNEPSVFSGPEITMHKDAKHYGGWEHRDVHNIYGMWQQAATSEGLRRRSGYKERPFVLSRAFFAGSQRYGAIWTGDNKADWGHLRVSIPMVLSIGVAGLPFTGADIGGFFGNPDTELLIRWYQVGAFYPFMRAHAHLDSKRREPYMFSPTEVDIIRDSIKARYSYLPLFYTLFREAATTGTPVLRPLWVEFPEDSSLFAEDQVFMVGGSLLVVPVSQQGIASVTASLPGTQPWYDTSSYQVYSPGAVTLSAPLSSIPVLQRGGTIVPRKMRSRRSSRLMHNDPFTLVVALDNKKGAIGELYVDDYTSYGYRTKKFILRQFVFAKEFSNVFTLSSKSLEGGQYTTQEWIERVVVAGLRSSPTRVTLKGADALDFSYDADKDILTVKKPAVNVADDFVIEIQI